MAAVSTAASDAAKLKLLRGAARQPSVTYRPPMRDGADADDLYSSRDTTYPERGPQSSIRSSGRGGGGRVTRISSAGADADADADGRGDRDMDISMTDAYGGGEQEQDEFKHRHHHAVEWSMVPIHQDDQARYDETEEEERKEEEEDEGLEAEGIRISPGYGDDATTAAEEEASLSACPLVADQHMHHTLTMHKDGCACDLHASATAAVCDTLSAVVVAAANVSGSGSAFNTPTDAAAPEPSSSCSSSSPEVSLHIHSASLSSLASLEASPAAAISPSEAQFVSSSLDPSFVVACVSPELLPSPGLERSLWEDSSAPYARGSLVPQAPWRTCACAYPWRTPNHLWTHHVQPPSHARNINFEGHLYPAWRGRFLPRPDPRATPHASRRLHTGENCPSRTEGSPAVCVCVCLFVCVDPGEFYPNGEPKSILRGVCHEFGFVAVCIYAIFVFRSVISTTGWIAAAVHILAQLMLYGTSSQFHRRQWALSTYNRLKRADHSCIFVLAAGTTTPSALLMLRDDWRLGTVSVAGLVLLTWSWAGAIAGVLHSAYKPLTGRVPIFGLVWMGQHHRHITLIRAPLGHSTENVCAGVCVL